MAGVVDISTPSYTRNLPKHNPQARKRCPFEQGLNKPRNHFATSDQQPLDRNFSGKQRKKPPQGQNLYGAVQIVNYNINYAQPESNDGSVSQLAFSQDQSYIRMMPRKKALIKFPIPFTLLEGPATSSHQGYHFLVVRRCHTIGYRKTKTTFPKNSVDMKKLYNDDHLQQTLDLFRRNDDCPTNHPPPKPLCKLVSTTPLFQISMTIAIFNTPQILSIATTSSPDRHQWLANPLSILTLTMPVF
ncbi:MAG: hypothetical protein OHK93_005450 [Ramalina farinacea]|uniref:Uncharacterized protein n=1 Tax=Ramalina farinacea TaxID=258253 RepID=A0AA43TSN2_9LECA|nr:hypothetical protein [Ramalina farinacea]